MSTTMLRLVAVEEPTDKRNCDSVNPEIMFPSDQYGRELDNQHPEVVAAKAVCSGCPMRDACLQGALERNEEWGVWGGMSARDRRASRRRRYRAAGGQTEMLGFAL